MALPTNFNSWRHFVSVITQIQNRIIREDFNDVGDDNWEPDINTDRGSLRTACTIRANDSAPLVILRLILYYVVLRKAQDLQIPYYGIPTGALQAQRKFRPQVTLYFSQDAIRVFKGQEPILGEISWRIMDETSETMTRIKLETLANKIKLHFGGATPFVWQKGRDMVTYTDWNEGLQLQLLCLSLAEGERVIRKVLEVHGGVFVRKKMNLVENQDENAKYPTIPPKEMILGKLVDLPRQRPIVDVRFRYATLSLHGLKRAIHLYDTTLRLPDCIVR